MPDRARPIVLIRGGGELATGAGHALAGAGARVIVLDRPLPTALRLGVAFASAVVDGAITVAGIEAIHVTDSAAIAAAWEAGRVPVWSGDEACIGCTYDLIVDARLRHLSDPITSIADAATVIGIGPGFVAGRDADYVIESNRGPNLGRVITSGQAETHTGIPGDVLGHRQSRILRAPCAGELTQVRSRGDIVAVGDIVARVGDEPVRANLDGMIRGLKLTGVAVGAGHKVGDVDPRRDLDLLTKMTDKAEAIGSSVVRAAILAGLLTTRPDDAPPASSPHDQEGTPPCI